MLSFDTSLNAQPPVSSAMRSKAIGGMRMKSPWAYTSQGNDVLGALADQNAVRYDLQADQSNNDFAQRQLSAQRDYALQGLQQMSQARQNQADLSNANSAMRYGIVSNLLSGLYR